MTELHAALAVRVDGWRAAGYPHDRYPAIAEILCYAIESEDPEAPVRVSWAGRAGSGGSGPGRGHHPACIRIPSYWSLPQEDSQHVSVGTAFHPRTAPLNRKMQWREWSGYFASSVYADFHDIEYNAIREAAALIDVSPALQVPRLRTRTRTRLVDRVITRDATKLAVGAVYYTPWCDEHGKVIDDGTVHRLDERRYRWTAADPQLRWLRQNSAGLDVTITEETEATAALALQGPLSRDVLEAATGESFADLRYFRRRAVEGRQGRGRRVADRLHRRSRLRAVGPGRGRGRASGMRSSRPARRTASARRGCSPSTSSGSRPGSSCSRSTTRRPVTR